MPIQNEIFEQLQSNTIEEADLKDTYDFMGFPKFMQLLEHNSSLKKLNLTGCNLRNSDISLLAKAIKDNSNLALQELTLSKTRLESLDIKLLTDVLKSNNTLTKLDISNNNLTIAGIRYLAEMLKENSSLKELTIEKNKTPGKPVDRSGNSYFYVVPLADALKVNKSLVFLSISGNVVSKKDMDYLAEAIATNTSLHHLAIDGKSISASSWQKIEQKIQANQQHSQEQVTSASTSTAANIPSSLLVNNGKHPLNKRELEVNTENESIHSPSSKRLKC